MSNEGLPREGWMAEKPLHVRVYHYIGESTRSLCMRYGFYFGELTPDKGDTERGREDCAECFRRLRKLRPVVEGERTHDPSAGPAVRHARAGVEVRLEDDPSTGAHHLRHRKG